MQRAEQTLGSIPSRSTAITLRHQVPHYAEVDDKGLYPGIDVVYHGNVQGQLNMME